MKHMLPVAFAAALSTVVWAQTVAQPAQPPRDPRLNPPPAVGTAVISGQVMMAGATQPARKVRVTLSGAELRSSRSTTTDDQGRFSFTALPAGRYTLSASKPGHLSVSYGQRRPGTQGTPIQLTDGQKFQAGLQIPRGSVLTGVVLDEHGEPTPGVAVRAMRFVMQNGQRTLQGSNTNSTDDRGIYRIYGLMPGEYAICATPRNTNLSDFERAQTELQGLRQTAATMANEEAARAIRDRIAAVQATMPQSAGEDTATGYAPVCYPGTTTLAEATPVPIGVSEERPGVDFQLRLVPMARVEGTVINSTGVQLQGMEITIRDLAPGSVALGTTGRPVDGEGRFSFPSVAPGQYRLTARGRVGGPQRGGVPPSIPFGMPAGRGADMTPRPEPITVWAVADISVDGRNLSNVMLTLQNGMTVSGQVSFEGGAQPPTDLTRMRVNLIQAEPGMPGANMAARVDASGRFTVASVVPGKYRISAGGAQGWSVESAVVGGVDALDFPFEVKPNQSVGGVTITMTDRQTELTGVLVDGRNQPAVDYTLVIFPADSKYWTGSSRRAQSTRPGTDGRYTFRNLPPGDYRIATLLDIEPGSLQNPAFLEQLETATMKITLAAGEKKTQDIRVQ